MTKKTKKGGYKCLMKISTSEKRDSTTPTPTPTPPPLPFSIPTGLTLKVSHENSQKKDVENSSIIEFQ